MGNSERQGALPLDPAKEPFEKRFFGISKTFWENYLLNF
jgi:hypothetical protein